MSLLVPFHRPPSLSASSKRLLAAAMIFEPSSQRIETKHWNRRSQARGYATSAKSLEDVFLRSLAIASSCSYHAKQIRCQRSFQRTHFYSTGTKKHVSSSPGSKSQAAGISNASVTREQLKNLVNTYGEPIEEPSVPVVQRKHPPLARSLVIHDEDGPHARRPGAPPRDKVHKEQLIAFDKLIREEYGTVPIRHMWEQYQKLPSPRVRHLSDHSLRFFLRHLTWVRYKNVEEASARYLEVIEECASENRPLTEGEWNSAISFANNTTTPGVENVQKALETWIRMQNMGVDPNNVTFNILFDIAAKAGRYALADTIAQEMSARDMRFCRFFFTMKIYYAGLRLDGDAVRQAFRDFVNANLIVDTTVMNCVLRSLVLAGEPEAAENVFAKMKWLFEQKMGSKGSENWVTERKRERELDKSEQVLQSQRDEQMSTFFGTGFSLESKKEELQQQTPIAPNSATYSTLVKYHAFKTGDFHRIEDLFREMEAEGIRIHGSIYTALFRAFAIHGGKRYTLWDVPSLEKLYEGYLSAVDFHEPLPDHDAWEAELDHEWRPRFTYQSIRAIIQAFYQCTGYKRTLAIYRELDVPARSLTEVEKGDLERILRIFAWEDSMYSKKRYTHR